MNFRILLFALLFCILTAGCRNDPAPAAETPAPALDSPAAENEQKSAEEIERGYNAEEALKGKVYMTPPPWLPHPAG